MERLSAVEQPDVIGGHQILDVVGRGACGVVYKALCPTTNAIVALKLLGSSLPGTTIDKLRFEREFRLASECDHPFLVKTLNYGTEEGRPYYTMELIDGVNFRVRFEKLLELDEVAAFSKVVDGLLDALAHIHEMGIVHRDLKPENVLVDQDNQPRILDFGLARPQYSEDAPRLTNPGTVLGTVHYLSPEQLSSRPLDGRSDIFSVGTMVYEVLAGRLPFDADNPMAVFGQILSQPPPAFSLPARFPPELVNLVMKLLNKEPADRFQGAREALNQWRRVMLGANETAIFRQVVLPEQLYMPRFVGQESALRAFDQIRSEEKVPRVLLVAGDAGSGKSRFLEECSARVKARGLPQSGARAPQGESLPYQLWIEPLRDAFKRPHPFLMPLRSVLSKLLPELGFFRDGAATKSQLFEAMSRALRARGGLVALDDVHYTDPASIEFLLYLGRSLKPDDSLVVVATYIPALAQSLLKRTRGALLGAEFAREQNLEPLSETEIQTMVGSMLGGEFDPDSSATLYRQTSGNPLHTGEAVKAALAENRLELFGGTWRLGAGGPATQGTVGDQLSRQLQSLEEQDREILSLAATIGFDFDFDLLSATSQMPKAELLDRILKVSDKGFLIESEAGLFRFGSRALLQAILESIPDDVRPGLHVSVAQSLEKRMPRQRWVVDIAHQYEAAGQPQKAVTHLLAAGAEASRNFAHKDARDFYRRALEVPAEQRSISDQALHEYIADALHGLGKYQEAVAEYERLLELAKATVSKVRLRRKIAEGQQMLGDFASAHRHLSEGLTLLGVGAQPAKEGAVAASWVQKTFSQLTTKFNSQDVMSHQIHRILDRQLSTLFFLRPPAWTKDVHDLASLQQDIASKLGNPEAAAQAQIFLGFSDLHQGKRESAVGHWDNVISIAQNLRDGPYKAVLLRNTGLMLLLAGDATRALSLCQTTEVISERMGDRAGLTQNHMVSCAIELHWGHFEKALAHARAMLASADDAGLPVYRALGFSYLARAAARTDNSDEAQHHLNKAMDLAIDLRLPFVDMMMMIARAWVLCNLNNFRESLVAVEEGLILCQEIEALPFYRLTLDCARLWASLEWLQEGSAPQEVASDISSRLEAFRKATIDHGVSQFVKIGGELEEWYHAQLG